MLSFIKKYKKILATLLSLLAFIGTIVFFGEKEKRQPTQKKLPQNDLPSSSIESSINISAGKSNLKDLETLGQADKVIENEDRTITYLYGPENDPQPDTVIVEENQVVFIKKRQDFNDPTNLEGFIEKYGQPNAQLYTNKYIGLKAYVFIEKGLAVIAGEGGEIIELRYFEPMTLDNFLDRWGQDLSKTPPTPPSLYY